MIEHKKKTDITVKTIIIDLQYATTRTFNQSKYSIGFQIVT